MSNKIRIGICGYGNIGKAVETVIPNFPDMELAAIFTRRNPAEVRTKSYAKVVSIDEITDWTPCIDVMIMCGGSATDLPVQVPEVCKMFNTVDSFDTHAKIPEYYDKVNVRATISGKTCLISAGWDPGNFSCERVKADAFAPQGVTYTFWGRGERGLSQGHSQAIRKVPGVKNGVQYTVPIQEAIDRVRRGETPEFTTREMHLRICYVVPEEGADTAAIEKQIKTMPNYFADYDTTVHFITEEELKRYHSEMAHGGFVIHVAVTGEGHIHVSEYSLNLDSNPEYTASVLLAYARAVYRMNQAGQYGAKTVLDIPIAMLSAKTPEQLRAELL